MPNAAPSKRRVLHAAVAHSLVCGRRRLCSTDHTTKRLAFHRLVRDAERHQFDAVVVHKLDRFARSVVVALSTFKQLNDLGISFLSLSEQGMDFTTPMGKVMFGMLALLAE